MSHHGRRLGTCSKGGADKEDPKKNDINSSQRSRRACPWLRRMSGFGALRLVMFLPPMTQSCIMHALSAVVDEEGAAKEQQGTRWAVCMPIKDCPLN